MAAELGVGRPTKRRSGAAAGGLPVADPRPVFDGQGVQGVRCGTCRYPVAQTGIPWCPACYGPVAPARFTPTGTVWSATVVAQQPLLYTLRREAQTWYLLRIGS